jgi:hypothetical protein
MAHMGNSRHTARGGNPTALSSGDNASFLATSGARGVISAPIGQNGRVMEHSAPTQMSSPRLALAAFSFFRAASRARIRQSARRASQWSIGGRKRTIRGVWRDVSCLQPTESGGKGLRLPWASESDLAIGVVWHCFGTATAFDRRLVAMTGRGRWRSRRSRSRRGSATSTRIPDARDRAASQVRIVAQDVVRFMGPSTHIDYR